MILSIGVLLLSSAALPTSTTAPQNDARLIEILSDARQNDSTAFQRLCKLGPLSTASIMDMLSTRVIHQDPKNAGPLLTDATRRLIFEAARTWPSKTVMRELNEWMTTESTLVDRIAADLGRWIAGHRVALGVAAIRRADHRTRRLARRQALGSRYTFSADAEPDFGLTQDRIGRPRWLPSSGPWRSTSADPTSTAAASRAR